MAIPRFRHSRTGGTLMPHTRPAEKDIAVQLSKAGVRLAFVLNDALRRQ